MSTPGLAPNRCASNGQVVTPRDDLTRRAELLDRTVDTFREVGDHRLVYFAPDMSAGDADGAAVILELDAIRVAIGDRAGVAACDAELAMLAADA